MKKGILRTGIMTAVALALSLTLTGCGGKSDTAPETGGGQGNNVSNEEAVRALDGTWVNDKGYALYLAGESSNYSLKTPGGRIGDGDFYASGAPDSYSISFNESNYDLVPVDDGSLKIVPADMPEDEDTEVLEELVFTRDDSADITFDFTALDGSWKAAGASLVLDIDAMEYKFSSDSTRAEGTINDAWDGRGWYLAWSYYDEKLEESVDDPAFLVMESEGRLHLEAKDPSIAPYTFVKGGETEVDLPAERDASMLKSQIQSIGAWTDDAGNALGFKADDGRYIFQSAGGRNGGGKLSFDEGNGSYKISFNGADYEVTLDENDFDVMYLTRTGGSLAGDGEDLDGARLTNDMFTMLYENPASFLNGSWTDDAGFTLNIDALFDDETPRFDYISRKGSGDGVLGNDEDGMGWYIPWKDSDGKAYLILDGSGADQKLRFETDDRTLAKVTLHEVE